MSQRYSEYVKAHPDRVEDMAYTLATRRERLKQASYCIFNDDVLSTPPPPVVSSGVVQTAFIFTGQGILHDPSFGISPCLTMNKRTVVGHG